MSLANYYMNLPFDLSGSMAKNRFRNEILWGLKKMFELYKEDFNYTVVFDYSCDVEVHKEDYFEFYQVKTQNNGGTYTVNKLTKTNKNGESILGKLYKLKYDPLGEESNDTKIAIVSNAPLNDGKRTHNSIDLVELGKIDKDAIILIKKSMRKELRLSNEIRLVNSNFVKTGLDLINPEKTLIGETVLFFEEVFDNEPKKVNALYRLLSSEVFNKSSYELQLTSYEELLEKKGINKAFLDNVLNKYIDNTDIAVEEVKKTINNKFEDNFKIRVKLNKALTFVSSGLRSNKQLKKIEMKIIDYVSKNLDCLPNKDEEIVGIISNEITSLITPEISEDEIYVLTLLVLKRFEEGVYE